MIVMTRTATVEELREVLSLYDHVQNGNDGAGGSSRLPRHRYTAR